MSDLFSLKFEFRGQTYSALARSKEVNGSTAFRVTIMNGELEKLLFGHQLFQITAGEVDYSSEGLNADVNELRFALGKVLSQHVPALIRA